MTTATRVQVAHLARDLAIRLGVGDEEARSILDAVCGVLRDRLGSGQSVELGDLLALTVAGHPELREDESGGFSAYAPRARSIAARPIGALKQELERACQAAIYYVARGEGTFKDLLADHFGRRGWKLVHTRNGMEVLGRLDRHPPVALVFESSAEGWRELVRELKCNPRTNWVPVVGLFPAGAADEPVRQLTVLPDDRIFEPFDFSAFIRMAGSELAERVTAVRHELLDLSVELPGTQRDRRDACHMVEEVLFRRGLPERFCREARAALAEALDNAARHGHRNVECCTISLRLVLDPKRLVLAVRDSGEGFDHSGVLNALRGRGARTGDPLARAANLLSGRESGDRESGIACMLRLVDRVDYNKTGNEVVLTKHLPDSEAETSTRP